MASSVPTRRGVLTAMALAPVAIVTPAVASPSSELQAKLAKATAAEQRFVHHGQTVREPAEVRHQEAEAGLPHETILWGREPWSTDNRARVGEARYFVDARHTVSATAEQGDYAKACVALVAAADRRAERLAAYVAEVAQATADSDALCDKLSDAIDEAVACPVSTAADLARKVAFINAQDWWSYETTHAAISADVAQLAG